MVCDSFGRTMIKNGENRLLEQLENYMESLSGSVSHAVNEKKQL